MPDASDVTTRRGSTVKTENADVSRSSSIIDHLGAQDVAADPAWERAYERFESPDQEVRKFLARLRWAGAEEWPKDLRIAELFCGRGSGLVAWARLGFTDLAGVDSSKRLLDQYRGPAKLHRADCRSLPFADRSFDVVSVHGGLHHLVTLPADLEKSLQEIRRVVGPNGRLLVVEPWGTPFLQLAHLACRLPAARRAWAKLDALATMIQHEKATYFNWLRRPVEILESLDRYFDVERRQIAWGKLLYLGRAR